MTAAEITGRHIVRDKTGDRCAACHEGGDYRSKRRFDFVKQGDGTPVLVMLCTDAAACGRRYRKGLTPRAYGSMVRRGLMP